MAAATEQVGEKLAEQQDASTYIQHHLTFFAKPVGESEGGFWTIHYDTMLTSLILGVLVLGFIWLVTRRATSGVPSKTQAFVELTIGFVNDQVRSMFHHDYRIVAPIALTVGLWVLFMNLMDLLPVDIMAWVYYQCVPPACVAQRAHGGRQHDIRAFTVGARPDDFLQHQASRASAAGCTNFMRRRSASGRCGPRRC